MKSVRPTKLLLIDDETAVRSSLRAALAPQSYQVEEAVDGQEALTKARSFAPEIIILDLGLPDLDGREVLKGIRLWSNASVLVLTVRDSDDEKVALLDAGADDYLTKPFSVSELLARLRVLERRNHASQVAQPVIETNGVEINFLEHTVRVEGKEVKVSATEFQLLRILAHADGKVVTVKSLLSQVWGEVGLANPHYIRIYIGQLRKKIEANPSIPTRIVTEPGVGYRFVSQTARVEPKS